MVRRKIEKTAALLIAGLILLLSLVYVPDWGVVGICPGASLLPRLGYSFFHTSILHASLNAWCLLSIVFLHEVSWRRLAAAYLIAVCVPDFILNLPDIRHLLSDNTSLLTTHYSLLPTVGLSALCFALLGLIAFNVGRKLYYQFCMAIYILLGFLFPFVNGWIHLYSYLAGLFVGLLVMPMPCRRRSARK